MERLNSTLVNNNATTSARSALSTTTHSTLNITHTLLMNLTMNDTAPVHKYSVTYVTIVGFILFSMILATAGGNLIVIIAVIKTPNLKTLTNRLIASLAFCDLLVGILVMPFAAIYHLIGQWEFGGVVCDIFITLDVMCCTSSILHLVAIAMDRYWTVSDVTYLKGNVKQNYFLPAAISGSWLLSIAIVLPPFFGWDQGHDPLRAKQCIISQNKAYTIYSTMLAFYMPMIALIIIYIQVFIMVRNRAHHKHMKRHLIMSFNLPAVLATTPMLVEPEKVHSVVTPRSSSNVRLVSSSDTQSTLDTVSVHAEELSTIFQDDNTYQADLLTPENETTPKKTPERRRKSTFQTALKVALRASRNKVEGRKTKRQKLAAKREKKALRTLLIITSVFVASWLPFFIIAIVVPFDGKDSVPGIVGDISIWLGYANSGLNPILYTIFNNDFRAAFKKLLRCRKR